jgi:hypothetical protein
VHHPSEHSCSAAASYLQIASSRGRCHDVTVGRSIVLREVALMFTSEHSRCGAGVKDSMPRRWGGMRVLIICSRATLSGEVGRTGPMRWCGSSSSLGDPVGAGVA